MHLRPAFDLLATRFRPTRDPLATGFLARLRAAYGPLVSQLRPAHGPLRDSLCDPLATRLRKLDDTAGWSEMGGMSLKATYAASSSAHQRAGSAMIRTRSTQPKK